MGRMATDPANMTATDQAEAAQTALNRRLASGAVGVASTSVDGTTIATDDDRQLRVTSKIVGRANRAVGRRPFFLPINLRDTAE